MRVICGQEMWFKCDETQAFHCFWRTKPFLFLEFQCDRRQCHRGSRVLFGAKSFSHRSTKPINYSWKSGFSSVNSGQCLIPVTGKPFQGIQFDDGGKIHLCWKGPLYYYYFFFFSYHFLENAFLPYVLFLVILESYDLKSL